MRLTCIHCGKPVSADDSAIFFSKDAKIYFSCSRKCKDAWLSANIPKKDNSDSQERIDSGDDHQQKT